MSETQNYKLVAFKTSDTMNVAASALEHYSRYIKVQIANADTQRSREYWAGRLELANAAMAEVFA